MADSKVIINKHYSNPASIDASVFSTKRKINQYGVGKDEVLREGEIVLCNDENNPGIYMMTHSASTENPGKVINMTSGENIKLSPEYEESQGTGSELELTGNDSVAQAFGKTSKRIADVEEKVHDIEESMQDVLTPGSGVSIDNGVISVLIDNTTIKFTPDGKLYSVGGGGGSQGGGTYIPGSYIAIDADNVISVTGITPSDYAIASSVTEAIGTALNEAKTYAEGKANDAESAAKSYTDTEVAGAKTYADGKASAAESAAKTYAEEKANAAKADAVSEVEGKGYQTEGQVREIVEDAIGGIDISEVLSAITEGDQATLQSAKDYTDGKVETVQTGLDELNDKVDHLDPSSIELITAYTVTITTPGEYDWQDGKVHDSGETGVFLVMVFGKPGQPDTYTYSYSDVTSLFNNELFLTEAEYETLTEEGEVEIDGVIHTYDPNKMYYTYEE